MYKVIAFFLHVIGAKYYPSTLPMINIHPKTYHFPKYFVIVFFFKHGVCFLRTSSAGSLPYESHKILQSRMSKMHWCRRRKRNKLINHSKDLWPSQNWETWAKNKELKRGGGEWEWERKCFKWSNLSKYNI